MKNESLFELIRFFCSAALPSSLDCFDCLTVNMAWESEKVVKEDLNVEMVKEESK